MSYINAKELTDGAVILQVHRYANRWDIGCGDSLWCCARCGENLEHGGTPYDPNGPDAGCRECGHGFPGSLKRTPTKRAAQRDEEPK